MTASGRLPPTLLRSGARRPPWPRMAWQLAQPALAPQKMSLPAGAGESVDEGDEVPGLIVGEFGGRHVGAGDAFADDLEDGVIGEGVPEGAADEIGTAGAAAAVGAVAAGAGAHEELGAGGDGFGVADSGVVGIAEIAAVLGEEGEGEEGESERAHRLISLCQVGRLTLGGVRSDGFSGLRDFRLQANFTGSRLWQVTKGRDVFDGCVPEDLPIEIDAGMCDSEAHGDDLPPRDLRVAD
jgi:hypothetical protein